LISKPYVGTQGARRVFRSTGCQEGIIMYLGHNWRWFCVQRRVHSVRLGGELVWSSAEEILLLEENDTL
jgi:hypothetical protein